MEIKNEYPPNWEKIKVAFPVENAPIIVTYEGRIYNPFGLPLRDDLIFHEQVHVKQQEKAKEKGVDWWEKYVNDKQWRVEIEAVAYGKQVKFIRERQGEVRALQALSSFAKYLSGKVYGEVITQSQAFNKIRKISRQ